ncbi:hypothetical protein X798_07748 [Onchocerca flexuosa]|uniref:Uncharacterized protein n=1 Tax=Onchocerca flexuosa TaxID=387005 RepID=A0A238BJ65_9BILA|nr:hypothetical protein X798_07748 [Onchocerca flexuosa]
MSSKQRETTVLRPSLKKQQAQAQARSKDSDAKRHVTFATPKLPSFKCNLPKQQLTSDQSISKSRKQKSVDAHRKRIPSVELVELRTKKNKHNEQIIRLCEAQEALVKSSYVIRRMGKEAKEQETAATALLQNAVLLIETDVLRSFEAQKIGDLLDNVEQQQHKIAQDLCEGTSGYNEKIASIEKALAAIGKCNEMLDMQFTFEENKEGFSVAEEMKLLSTDIETRNTLYNRYLYFYCKIMYFTLIVVCKLAMTTCI